MVFRTNGNKSLLEHTEITLDKGGGNHGLIPACRVLSSTVDARGQCSNDVTEADVLGAEKRADPPHLHGPAEFQLTHPQCKGGCASA